MGEKISLEKIESHLIKYDIDIVAIVHHETSTGMLNSLEEVGALLKANNIMFIVDCVSSAGAEIIDMEKHHIAYCSGSSSKAIGSYPGLSFIVGKTQEFEKLKNLPVKSGYLNLYKFYYYIKTFSQTPNTPAVPLLFALEQTLINILNEGISNRYANLKSKANFLREGMLNLGFDFLINQKDMCSILTTVNAPSFVDVDIIHKKLREKSIIIYKGKGPLKEKVFQVGNIGELSFDDMQFFLDSLEEILKSFGALRKIAC